MGFLEERSLDDVPTIREYYNGKTIFITGGTGFMGKVLIEKLLYSCTGLNKIYLLLRSKKGLPAEKRLSKLYAIPCFDRLRKEKPGLFESKVKVVNGDVSERDLGLSQEDRNLLVQNVNIIFHAAASVRFNDSLTKATLLNLRGTKELVELALKMKNLESFVHVSTSYANTNRDPIDEVMYPPHADWKETLDVCENIDEHTLNILTSKYIGNMPNTYVFTKQLAENVIYEHRGRLPVVIIRPSVVIGSVDEPIPGWIDNFNGPVGILVATGKGILRAVYSEEDVGIDYMPVDLSIKHLITAAWIRGTKELNPADDVEIYNCCCGKIRSVTNGQVFELGKEIIKTVPLDNVLWKFGISFTTSVYIYTFKVFFLHLLPALFIDLVLWIAGKKPMLVKIQRKIYTTNMALQYYMTQQWKFTNDNFIALRACINEQDKKDFYYDVEGWDNYLFFKECTLACRRYLLNEKDEDLSKAQKHLQRMVFLDYVVKFLFFLMVFWKLLSIGLGLSMFNF